MTPGLVGKLRKVLPLLGSDKPGEVVAAAGAAGRLLAAERMGWVDLAEHLAPLPVRVDPPPPPPEDDEALATWTALIDRCLKSGAALKLPARDYNFLHGLLWQVQNRKRGPSPKQRAWLAALAERLSAV